MCKRIHQGSHWIKPVRRYAIYNRDGFTCVYCGKTVENTTLSLDHIRTLADSDKPDNRNVNLVTACRDCNSRRGKLDVAEFADKIVALRILHQILLPLDFEAAKAILASQKAMKGQS